MQIKEHGLPVLVLFEGWGTAGKGSVLGKVIKDLYKRQELLIDFTEAGHSQGGRKLFEQNPGGAPANLLTVASHFGYRTSFSIRSKIFPIV